MVFEAWSLRLPPHVTQESDLRIRQMSVSVITVPGDNFWNPFQMNPGSVS